MSTFNPSSDPATTPAQESIQSEAPQQETVSFHVGERAYDIASATKKIESADQHINQLLSEKRELEAQMQTMQQQLAQSTKVEEALANLQVQPSAQESVSQPQLDLEKLQANVLTETQKLWEQREREKAQQQLLATQEENFKNVSETMVDQYGAENVDKVITEKAKSLDMSFDQAVELAKQNPKLFISNFGKTATSSQTTSSLNSQAFQVNSTNVEGDLKNLVKQVYAGKLRGQQRTAAISQIEALTKAKLGIN